jgi:hypothetical protein
MIQYCVTALVKGTTINRGLRLVLSHLWASENVKQYRTLHLGPTYPGGQAKARPPRRWR